METIKLWFDVMFHWNKVVNEYFGVDIEIV